MTPRDYNGIYKSHIWGNKNLKVIGKNNNYNHLIMSFFISADFFNVAVTLLCFVF